MTKADIEKRLAAIEREISRLKATLGVGRLVMGHPVETLDAIHGTFEDDDAFREAARLGRVWRESQNEK